MTIEGGAVKEKTSKEYERIVRERRKWIDGVVIGGLSIFWRHCGVRMRKIRCYEIIKTCGNSEHNKVSRVPSHYICQCADCNYSTIPVSYGD